MIKNRASSLISLILCHIFSVTVILLCFLMPLITSHVFEGTNQVVVMTAYYVCVPIALLAMYLLSALLRSIRKSQVFIMTNVLRLRLLSWCCGYVTVVSFIAGLFYFPMMIISFCALFMCIILRVVKNVIYAAVEIKKENELTI